MAGSEDLDDPLATAAARYGLALKRLSARERYAFAALARQAAEAQARCAALSESLAAAQAAAAADVLAPVLNRRAFLSAVERHAAFVERYGGEAAVVYLDLDRFKALNDGFGHAVGDAALIHVARLLRDNVRDSDAVGRLGGDEFGVLLAQSGAEEARRKALSLAELIAATPLLHEGLVHPLSASIGVHPLARSESAESALARADEAMYAHKRVTRRA